MFKLATRCSLILNNYIIFNQADGIYSYIFEAERKSDCLACNRQAPKYLEFQSKDKLGKFYCIKQVLFFKIMFFFYKKVL